MKKPMLISVFLTLAAFLTSGRLRSMEIISGQTPKECSEGAMCVAACESGAADACYYLGMRFSRATVNQDDGDLAKQYFQQGCDVGSDKSCREFGEMETAIWKSENWKNGLAALENSCLSGGMNSCAARALLKHHCQPFFGCARLSGGLPQEEETALEQTRYAAYTAQGEWNARAAKTVSTRCQGGDTESCHRLIELLDPASAAMPLAKNRAADMARADCIDGDAIGCVWLEVDLASGPISAAADHEYHQVRTRADGLFQQGCERDGNWLDCRNYFNHNNLWGVGEAGQSEYSEFKSREGEWLLSALKRGCDRKHPNSCLAFARDAEQELPEVAAVLTETCDAGVSQACIWLARKLLYGEGVSKQEDRAIKLYEANCGAGGCKILAEFYGAGWKPPSACSRRFCEIDELDFAPLTNESVKRIFHWKNIKLANSYLDQGCKAGDAECCMAQKEGGYSEEIEETAVKVEADE